MSTVKISGNASGSGSLTIAAPNTNSDLTLNLPTTLGSNNGSAVVTTDAAGNLGLGVTPSAWSWKALQVGSFGGAFATNSAAYASYLGSNCYYDGSNWRYIGSSGAVHYELAGGDRAHKWYTAPSGTAGNAISFTQALTLNANGNLALQGGNTSANGVGITFPATQSASSDANTLDDYEEGTWTPAVLATGSNPTVSYGNQFGFYTKIGDTVTAHINITANSRSGGSGSVQITLPFPVTSANQFLAQSSLEIRGVTFTSGYTYAGTLCVFNSGAKVYLRQYGSGLSEIDLDIANVTTGAFTFRCTVVYKV